MNKTLLLAAALLLPIGGCATMSQPKQVALVISKCPVLKNYSKSQLKKAALELKDLPSESEVATMVTDYSKLRDACRVANKLAKKSVAKKK